MEMNAKTMEILFPNLLDKFQVTKTIGLGGFSRVLEVIRLRDGKHFACKTNSMMGDDKLILQELKIMAQLRHDPGVVRLIGIVCDLGFCHIIMELCEGTLLLWRILASPGKRGRKRGLKESCDIWALGVTLYEMLTGKIAYEELQTPQVLLILFDWSRVPVLAKDLMLGMLNLDKKKRLTAAQILEHPWIKRITQNYNRPAPETKVEVEAKQDVRTELIMGGQASMPMY
ncbi:ribosomal protein S6 kinase 2 alpha [Selaginella moellendorffii]|uniref:ribosomal protein S6 kinase 2 alpha n=1 Tax=Selaginella moellendorffii TaxID=88036 RepID=UPI000D1CEA39|nr:ribosomal protein S6 kinase 2 alpha [Selaginella moellendorffii]|eukprot:XP_024544755.1 ribosomal protein S6 kinase 2 alpha [Selaginella moellendorffii]